LKNSNRILGTGGIATTIQIIGARNCICWGRAGTRRRTLGGYALTDAVKSFSSGTASANSQKSFAHTSGNTRIHHHKQENGMVQVWAKDAAMAALLTHPISKVGFADPSQPANWPDDQFTARRIRDGDVTTTDPNAESRSGEHHRRKKDDHTHD
jgi:hypothetical protein